jgi:hypothetical protein
MGVNADGRRELLGLKVGDSENEAFWAEFISSLKERGLGGDKLVISDVPGVNYVGGSRQLRRRVGALLPLPWQGEATSKTEPPAGQHG